MSPILPAPIARWHEVVATKDLSHFVDLLADDVVLHSPVVHVPQRGKALVANYLRAAVAVLGNDSFRFVGEWLGERSAVLELEVTISDVHVNGVDMIHWDDEGRVTQFKVMMRPLKALNAIAPLMARQLQAAGHG